MESVFDDDDIYSWFEPGDDGSLYCAFATEPGYLLGENVRNWLRETRRARDFVYCERMGNQRAVVLVVDGQVVKDALVGGYELSVEMRHALGRLDKAAPGGYDVFLHGLTIQDLQLADLSRSISLEDSLLDWMEDAPGPLPELNPTNRAIGVIDVVAKRLRQLRILRTIGLAVGSVLIATLGVYWWMKSAPSRSARSRGAAASPDRGDECAIWRVAAYARSRANSSRPCIVPIGYSWEIRSSASCWTSPGCNGLVPVAGSP